MARINTNVGAIVAQRHLNSAYGQLNTTLQKLSSGLRITRGADDPAGLIVSERLRTEVAGVAQGIRNSQRAINVIATAEGSLNEVAALLNSIQALVVEAANTGAFSDDEIKANQLQIDSAISSITRIANATTFAGRALLNGSLDYITSGVNQSVLTNVSVRGALFGTQPYIPVNVEVTTSAQPATLYFAAGSVASSVNIELRGNLGVVTLPFGAGTTASAIVAAVNAVSDTTGVEAVLSANPTSGFVLQSTEYGSKQFVAVSTLPGSGSFVVRDESNAIVDRDEGRDVVAEVNGASAVGEGLRVTYRQAALDVELNIAKTFGLGTTSFAITGGGSLFQLGGHVNANEQVGVGVQSVSASRLGDSTIGFLSQIVTGETYDLSTETGRRQASKIVGEAQRQVSLLRGRLGAFEKNVLDTNINQLGITVENLMAAESTIRDADFAAETSRLTRNQILVSAGTSALALANQTPQSVLALLNG
ncbi:MAG: hypothetical protein CHACPFDD_02509 [Phycisphaerae bacterium]|nr:hypothetical protein [Phycisphaerae bacterium]